MRRSDLIYKTMRYEPNNITIGAYYESEGRVLEVTYTEGEEGIEPGFYKNHEYNKDSYLGYMLPFNVYNQLCDTQQEQVIRIHLGLRK
jgi:hypothetical protein